MYSISILPDLSLCRVDEGLTVRVGDFGLARDIYTSHYYRANKEARLPVKWMAPETLNDGISNEKTDMVSRSCGSVQGLVASLMMFQEVTRS